MASVYTAEATAWGGREGRVATSDGVLDLQLRVPKDMGGPGGEFANPELLFASGYAACFHGAFKLAASRKNVDVSESAITVQVGIGPNESGGFELEAKIEAEVPGVEEATVRDLLEDAHQICPYSNATRGNMAVEFSVAQN